MAARTKYYRADMLARKGEAESSCTLMLETQKQFQKWEVPSWQRKCEQALQTILQDNDKPG